MKYYAVLSGREGPNIYHSRIQFEKATTGYSTACSKSFLTRDEAIVWLTAKGAQLDHFRDMDTPGATRNDASEQQLKGTKKHPEKHHNIDASDDHVAEETTQTSLTDVRLSDEQLRVLDLITSGKNVFFTGAAGTGKSVLLRTAIHSLREQGLNSAITATTGIAGVNIGGSTVHSFAGIGLGKESAGDLADMILTSQKKTDRWRFTKALIIDEISMMDGRLFDKLEKIARIVRRNQAPFGGLQLVLSGDFFQLPPVPDESHEHRMPSTFAFEAVTWKKCIHHMTILRKVFRQKDDSFIEILTAMRSGVLSPAHIHRMQTLSRPVKYQDGIEPCYIFPLRKEAEACNNGRLAALPGTPMVYASMDSIGYDYQCNPIPDDVAPRLFEQLNCQRRTVLKVGAQVMLLQNVEARLLVNGSVGKVTEFLTIAEATKRMIKVAEPSLKHVPLRYADAPMRRCTPEAFNPRKDKYPLVKFTNGRELLCAPLDFSVQGFMGNVEVLRWQVPLMLAWAMSIHKSQGQTLERVKVDLGHVFERGQAYVAISRATTMEGLEVINFQPGRVMAHPKVIQWQKDHFKAESFGEEMDGEEAISAYWDAYGKKGRIPRV